MHVSRYDLYYSLTHLLKWKPFRLETCTDSHYLVFNCYQINEDDKIWTRDRLVNYALIPCQIINLIQWLKLLGNVSIYNLYYSLTVSSWMKYIDTAQ
jgi:aryl carrier-like protein